MVAWIGAAISAVSALASSQKKEKSGPRPENAPGGPRDATINQLKDVAERLLDRGADPNMVASMVKEVAKESAKNGGTQQASSNSGGGGGGGGLAKVAEIAGPVLSLLG